MNELRNLSGDLCVVCGHRLSEHGDGDQGTADRCHFPGCGCVAFIVRVGSYTMPKGDK